jgi:hypothetical protein
MFTPGSRRCGYKTVSGQRQWLSRDPIEERGGFNLYAFAKNNCPNTYDKLGHKCCLLTWYPSGIPFYDFEYGHSSLQCDSDVYVSAWPTSHGYGDVAITSPVEWIHSRPVDQAREGRPPDWIECSDCIDGTAVASWYSSITNRAIFNMYRNCSIYTLEALAAGLKGPQNRPSCQCESDAYSVMVVDILASDAQVIRPFPSFPSDTLKAFQELKKNKCQRYKCEIAPLPNMAVDVRGY